MNTFGGRKREGGENITKWSMVTCEYVLIFLLRKKGKHAISTYLSSVTIPSAEFRHFQDLSFPTESLTCAL